MGGALRRAAHQTWQWTYRVSCNEISDMILHRFCGNGILRSVLYVCVQMRRIIEPCAGFSDSSEIKGFCHLPNVHFFRHGLVAYDLRSHPGHRPSEGHLGALVAEFFGRAKVRNLHRVVVGDQHAGMMMHGYVYNPTPTHTFPLFKCKHKSGQKHSRC